MAKREIIAVLAIFFNALRQKNGLDFTDCPRRTPLP